MIRACFYSRREPVEGAAVYSYNTFLCTVTAIETSYQWTETEQLQVKGEFRKSAEISIANSWSLTFGKYKPQHSPSVMQSSA